MRLLAAAGVLFAACARGDGELATYSRHGFEVRYPSDHVVHEGPLEGAPADADHGQVTISDPHDAEGASVIGVAWRRVDGSKVETDGAIERGVDGALAGAERADELAITRRGSLQVLDRGDGRLAYRSFSGRPPTDDDTVFGVAGTFYCPRSERLFVLVAAGSHWRSESSALRAFQRYFAPLRC